MNLFDGSMPSAAAPPSQPQPSSASLDLLDSSSTAESVSQAPPSGQQAYSKNDLHITISVKRASNVAQALARFTNTGIGSTISNLSLQVAVPKTQKLQLQALGSEALGPGQEVTQSMRVVSDQGVSLSPASIERANAD